MNINYDFTWCDFLTPCPYGKDCMVGDYDCSICEYYNGNNTLPIIDDVLTDYGKYSRIYKGCIKCNKINNGNDIPVG